MKYSELNTNDKEWELLVDNIWIVILKPTRETGPESNLCLFESEKGNLLARFDPAIQSDSQWDGFINVWITNGQVYTGTWSGYEYRVNLETLELINQTFKQ